MRHTNTLRERKGKNEIAITHRQTRSEMDRDWNSDWNSGSVTGRDRHDNYIPWSKKNNDTKKQKYNMSHCIVV